MQVTQNKERMKRILLSTFVVLTVLALCFSASAWEEYTREDMKEDEFVIASIHDTSSFVKNDDALVPLYDSLSWACYGHEDYNIKTVAILGGLTSGSKTVYADYVTNQGHTYAEYIAACLAEEGWHNEWSRLVSALSVFTENGFPFSVTMNQKDYPADGGKRDNLYESYFNANNLFPASTKSTFYDGMSYYYIFSEGDIDYIVFNLELWPRQAVLEWVDMSLEEHSDKRAIIYTQSFLDKDSEMIRMFDWDYWTSDLTYAQFLNKYAHVDGITTLVKRSNMCSNGKPHDGDMLWEKCFKKHDNVFLIVCASNGSSSEIKTKLLVNDGGYDVLAVSANSSTGENIQFLFTGIADKGETITLNYYNAYEQGINEKTTKTFALNLKEVTPTSEKDPDITYLMTIDGQTQGANKAYINGLENNRFGPQENMTRAQAITIIARLIDPEESFKGEYKSHFTDVNESDWYYDYVSFLYCGQLLGRYGDTLEPNKPITRAEFVELLYLANAFEETPRIVVFKDVPKASDFFDAVCAAAANGIVNGYEDYTFRPDNNITRAEVVTIINRTLGLLASAELIDESTLDTVFADIGGHWAYYNILLSSNNNVKAKSIAADIDTSRITEDDMFITLSTDHVDIKINKTTASVASVIDKATGKDIFMRGSQRFLYLTDNMGTTTPSKLEFKDNKLVFSFTDGTVVNVIADVKAEYFTLEIENEIPKKYKSIEFGSMTFNYSLDEEDGIAAITYTMNVNTNPNEYPDAKSKTTRATALRTSLYGVTGAKAAFIIAPHNLHRDYMKLAMAEIDRDVGIASYTGGPYALDYKENYGDYVIVRDSDPASVQAMIDLYGKYDVDTVDFHKSASATHREGDFVFAKTTVTGAYKVLLETLLDKKGIAKDAQPYSYYVSPEGAALLGEEWSSSINHLGSYTLGKDFGNFAVSFAIQEDINTLAEASKGYNTLYVAIDDELLTGVINNGKISNIKRAQAGTKSSKHTAGAKVEVFVSKGTGASAFKALVSDPLEAAGITSGLHTYAYFISPDASELWKEPRWLAQLETMEVFTLASDISASATVVPTVESTQGKAVNTNFFARDSVYIVIDDELIKMTFGPQGFVNCTRGVGGTVATSHKAGSTIRHIGGCFNLLGPDVDSDLFLEVARRTAQAYNEGGFEMIYLDALDGLGRANTFSNNNSTSNNSWYYAAIFVNEILKYCETDPIIENSAMQTTLWNSRGRMGAWDTPSRAYKDWNEAHAATNQTFIDRYYVTTLGWYNFYPNEGGALYDWEQSAGYPGNFWNKYEFFDDVDHMGSLAVAYDMTVVYNPMTQSNIDTIPAFKRNVENYMRYNTLRKEGYFSEETKAYIRDVMKNSDIEFALVDKADGSHAFVEKYYHNQKLIHIDLGKNTISGNNPFEAQKPFIRIQNYLSTDGSEPITVMNFDETKDIKTQTLTKTFSNLNLMSNLAFKIKVYGNNSGDAIAIKLQSASSSETAYIYYVIPLDFSGWKEFVLAETDNGPMTLKYGFTSKSGTYSWYRAHLNYDKVTNVTIETKGDCTGVKVGNLLAVAHKNNPIINPTITLGSEAITFNTTLDSSQYLEYNAGDAKAYVYDAIGNAVEVDVTGTTPTFPAGDFTATLTGTDSDTMPMRAEVTFGFTGKEIN